MDSLGDFVPYDLTPSQDLAFDPTYVYVVYGHKVMTEWNGVCTRDEALFRTKRSSSAWFEVYADIEAATSAYGQGGSNKKRPTSWFNRVLTKAHRMKQAEWNLAASSSSRHNVPALAYVLYGHKRDPDLNGVYTTDSLPRRHATSSTYAWWDVFANEEEALASYSAWLDRKPNPDVFSEAPYNWKEIATSKEARLKRERTDMRFRIIEEEAAMRQ